MWFKKTNSLPDFEEGKIVQFNDLFFFFEKFCFSDDTTVNIVATWQFKVCLSVWAIFFWTINHINLDPMLQILYVFLMQITFVCTSKIMIRCLILFTESIKIFFESLFSHYFWMSVLISIIFLLLLKWSHFHRIAIWQFKICLSVHLFVLKI